MKIEGVDKLKSQMLALAGQSKREDDVSVIVGYTAAYALHVHENIEMAGAGMPRKPPGRGLYWDPQGRAQAKFLEAPARMYRERIKQIALDTYAKSKNLSQSLLMAGLYLQRESMLLVPVDTGNLKGSAFTRKEDSQAGVS